MKALFEITAAITVTGGLMLAFYGLIALADCGIRKVRQKNKWRNYVRYNDRRNRAIARKCIWHTIEK